MKDPSKPDGEAVNPDGTLKAANQIKWVNSPTDELHQPEPNQAIPDHDDSEDIIVDAAEPDENHRISSDHGINDFDVDMYLDSLKDDHDPKGNGAEDVEEAIQANGEESEDKDEEDENTGKEEDNDVSEEEDVDADADKRYWEAKAKEGVHRVSDVTISEAVNNINKLPKKNIAKEKKPSHTRYSAQLPARCSAC